MFRISSRCHQGNGELGLEQTPVGPDASLYDSTRKLAKNLPRVCVPCWLPFSDSFARWVAFLDLAFRNGNNSGTLFGSPREQIGEGLVLCFYFWDSIRSFQELVNDAMLRHYVDPACGANLARKQR